MEDPKTRRENKPNQNQVRDRGQRFRLHQIPQTQERGEGNSQDCKEGSNHIQRQKAVKTICYLDAQHCLATLLFFHWQLYLQFSAARTSKLSHTSQIIDLATFSISFISNFLEKIKVIKTHSTLLPALWIPHSLPLPFLPLMCIQNLVCAKHFGSH